VVVFEGNAGVNGAAIHMVELFEPFYDAVLKGLGQSDVVC
jgi:hypothetical protein